ncbi:MAG: prepilin-type N-terminal cleavage/methylation domain-containing protein [Gammaproteobacteria bacterium]|nr:prepilin-type N-terminal cleavage/methylation domain-containing protein [Gammaproteobacteria bacterium]
MDCHDLRQCGFAIVELMMTVAIVAILAAIVIPSYRTYQRQNYYTQMIKLTLPYRQNIENCEKKLTTFVGCNDEVSPNQAPASQKTLRPVIEVKNGVITVKPNTTLGVYENDIYTLTPSVDAQQIRWKIEGGAYGPHTLP